MTTTPVKVGQGWTVDDSTFGARLALVRQKMDWNIKEAARECGLPGATWRTWERDGVEPRRLGEISKIIARRTGCDYGWLLGGPELQGAGYGTSPERQPILQSVYPPERTRPNGHPKQKTPHRGTTRPARVTAAIAALVGQAHDSARTRGSVRVEHGQR